MSIRRIVGVVLLVLAAVGMITVLRDRAQPSGTAEENRIAGEKIPQAKRSLVLITVDTTRPDRLQPYGSQSVATPALQRLADEGIVFERAYSVAPITLVAHTSILTGLEPLRHGVRNNGMHNVSQDVTTLAEDLGDQGYRTAAFVSAAVLDKQYGLDQGFEHYDDDLSRGRDRSPRMVPDRPAEVTVGAAMEYLDSLNKREKYFLWIHLYDPHARYSPPPPFRDQYRGSPYDGEIAYMDSQIGRLLEHRVIAGSNGWSPPIVSVIGDHGESHGEHGERTHAMLAYDSTLHVPWILRIPGGPKGLRYPETVGQVDVRPTLLSLLGHPVPDTDGRDLVARLEGAAGGDPAYWSETHLPFYTYGWAKLNVLRSGRWKYIDAPRPELYDTVKDPRELSNQFELQPGIAHDLARDLRERLDEVEPMVSAVDLDLDAEALENLRSLGYLQVGSGTVRERSDRPDPKDVVDVHVGLERARLLLQDHLYEDAERQLRVVLERDQGNLAALVDLSEALRGQGSVEEAVQVVEQALSLDPEYVRLYLMLASLENERGNHDKALELGELAQQRDPRSTEAAGFRANLLAAAGRTDEARTALESALESNPDNSNLNHAFARLVEMPGGDLDAAEARLRRVVARDPFHALAWRSLGRVLSQTKRLDEAIEAFREGLRKQPDNGELLGDLGRLLAQQGRQDEAEAPLREALRLSPRFRRDLHVTLGGVMASSGRFLEALREYQIVLDREPSYLPARNNRAIALLQSGRVEEALADLREVVAMDPDYVDAHNNLAAAAIHLRDWPLAERHARQAAALAPDAVEAWSNLGIAQEELGRLPQALSNYERALAIDPEYVDARHNLGILLGKLDRREESRQAFERVLESTPEFAESHLELARLLAENETDSGPARAHFNAFLRLAPQDPRASEVRNEVHGLSGQSP